MQTVPSCVKIGTDVLNEKTHVSFLLSKLFSLFGIEGKFICQTCSLVTTLTELSWLHDSVEIATYIPTFRRNLPSPALGNYQ